MAESPEPLNPQDKMSAELAFNRSIDVHYGVAEEVAPDEAVVPYNLACYWSLAGKKDQALTYLSRAIAMDPEFRERIHEEPDFDPIRSDPEFRALTEIIV